MLIVGDRELLADVARRWKSNKQGMPLRAKPFAGAVAIRCPDNAARYVERHRALSAHSVRRRFFAI